ncbi:MAG: hypothetical protein LBS93_01795, partial [Synergistaceae bacterium]|nr:hypothetical protein [Synergistaceae bacterium]
MSTKSVIIAAVFAALIASLAFGVVTMGTWSGPDASDGSAGAFPGPEIALPGVTPDDEYVFLKLAHPEKFGSALSSFGGAMTGITENEALSAIFSRSLDLAEVPRIVGLLGGVTDFLDGAEQMALLATSSDKAVYISLFADDESFDKFISPQEGSVRKVEEWRADGWKFSVGGSPSFYMAKKPFENSNLVMVSFSEEGVDAMITASGGSPFVLPGDRRTSGEDCFRARVSPAALAGMEWMSGRGPLSIELSWSSDGRRT